MILVVLVLSLICINISLATMPMDYGAAVNILGPTVDKMASSIRRGESTRSLGISSIAVRIFRFQKFITHIDKISNFSSNAYV